MKPVRLGQHELLVRLAAGGAANVFLTRDLNSPGQNRLLALKILLPSLASNEDFLNMFFTEAQIASKLSHENIGSITGFGQVEGIHCLAMEYVFGASLAQVLRASARAKRPLTVGVLLRITASVCDALHFAHELRTDDGELMGLVHRDVTPQNILIGFNGVPKLTDFGIAKATGRGWETQAGIVKGKFSYMSPEQATGKKVDRRSDIFGAGIVLWEALTGRDLFTGSTAMDVLSAIREQKIDAPSKVVPGLTPIVDPIVMKALRRSPRARYQTAAEMRDDILGLISRAGVDIEAGTIAKEFYAIYGDDVTSRAVELKKASMGKPDLDMLAKCLGAQPLHATQLPVVPGGVTDPDPLGLFPEQQSLPTSSRSDFEVVDESADLSIRMQKSGGTDWNTGEVEAQEDELLSMLSEEDATVGHVPPEFVERLAKSARSPLLVKHGFADNEATVGVGSEDAYPEHTPSPTNWTQEFDEDDDFDMTEARSVSDGLLRGTSSSTNPARPVPRAPSLFLDEHELDEPARRARTPRRPRPTPPSVQSEDVPTEFRPSPEPEPVPLAPEPRPPAPVPQALAPPSVSSSSMDGIPVSRFPGVQSPQGVQLSWPAFVLLVLALVVAGYVAGAFFPPLS